MCASCLKSREFFRGSKPDDEKIDDKEKRGGCGGGEARKERSLLSIYDRRNVIVDRGGRLITVGGRHAIRAKVLGPSSCNGYLRSDLVTVHVQRAGTYPLMYPVQ